MICESFNDAVSIILCLDKFLSFCFCPGIITLQVAWNSACIGVD